MNELEDLSLSCVFYQRGDLIGKILAFLSLSPLFIVCAAIAVFLSRREFVQLYFCGSLFFCEFTNVILKRLIKEARPENSPRKGHGMPSDHAQFMFFFAILVTFMLITYKARLLCWGDGKNRTKWESVISKIEALIVSISCFGLATVIAFSRVYLNYHTYQQVAAGAVIGVILGVLACLFYMFIYTSWIVPAIEKNIFISRLLLLRNSNFSEGLLYHEWLQYRKSKGLPSDPQGIKPN